MTHLIRCLRSLMRNHKIRAADLARTIEVSTASLSRILNGRVTPSHETLKFLIRLVAKNEEEARAIIRAHLMDEIERLDSMDLADVVVGSGGAEPGHEHLLAALHGSAQSLEEIAALSRHLAELAEKQAARARAAVRAGESPPVPNSKSLR